MKMARCFRAVSRIAMAVVGMSLASLTGACELEETSLTEPESLLVAEVFVEIGDGRDQIFAFLQRTLGSPPDPSLGAATIRLEGPRGFRLSLTPSDRRLCLVEGILDDVEGACFTAPNLGEDLLRPGDYLEVSINTAAGDRMRGGMTLPQGFSLILPGDEACALAPGVPLEISWTPSEGAWAYAGETLIWNLRDALRPVGIQVEEDSLNLLGLSISESDTTLVFPQEFGVFDRFDLDRDVALALQEGLPLGAEAEVVVGALDRNYANWVRGGNFNPSGAIRIPSLQGDGTGVLAGVVRRLIRVVGATPDGTLPPCVPDV